MWTMTFLRFVMTRRLLPHLQGGGEPDAEAVRIGDRKVPQTVIAIGNGNDDSRPNFFCQLPMVVHIGNHHSDIRERQLCGHWQLLAIESLERRRLGEKEPMTFPGQFHKIAPVSKQRKTQSTIELRGTPDVANDDLGHELLRRIDVPAHGTTAWPQRARACRGTNPPPPSRRPSTPAWSRSRPTGRR